MDITDLFLILFYGVALFFVIIFISSFIHKPQSPQIIVIEEQPVRPSLWPWNTTSYNYWPYWTGWWSGGSDGGYYPKRLYPTRHHYPSFSTRPWGGPGRHANTGGFHKSH